MQEIQQSFIAIFLIKAKVLVGGISFHKVLTYFSPVWECQLMVYSRYEQHVELCTQDEELRIKLSQKIAVRPDDITIIVPPDSSGFSNIKFSHGEGVDVRYSYRFLFVEIGRISMYPHLLSHSFEVNGITYSWMTVDEMKSNRTTYERNYDVIRAITVKFDALMKIPLSFRHELGDSGCDARLDIAISFAGEDRIYAEELATLLIDNGVRVFYDAFAKAELWGEDLYSYLDNIYRTRARFCVVLISKHYAGKLWTNHERRSAQARAFSDAGVYILPIRLDSTDLPGLPPTVGYLQWQNESAEAIVGLIIEKLRGGQS